MTSVETTSKTLPKIQNNHKANHLTFQPMYANSHAEKNITTIDMAIIGNINSKSDSNILS